jgi:translation initiation factor 2-alpha kinase 4
MTKDIGTAFYIPPEAKRTTSFGKNYDEKFDIYSIGIVLFEMIMKPADSRSERIVILERLRNEIVMPAEYLNYLPENQRNNADSIIRWCLSDSPEQRPSATELLQSNRLPQIISEDDRFHKTISQLAQDPKHRLRRQLFNELFSPSLPPPIGLLYDKHFCNVTSKYIMTKSYLNVSFRNYSKGVEYFHSTVQLLSFYQNNSA